MERKEATSATVSRAFWCLDWLEFGVEWIKDRVLSVGPMVDCVMRSSELTVTKMEQGRSGGDCNRPKVPFEATRMLDSQVYVCVSL